MKDHNKVTGALALFVVLLSWPLMTSFSERLTLEVVVWDVGQGLWITAFTNTHCLHFDSGGEKSPNKHRLDPCRNKPNLHYLSHLDWDHLNFLHKVPKPLCRVDQPRDGMLRQKRFRRYQKEVICQSHPPRVKELTPSSQYTNKKYLPNELSRVFLYDQWLLLPGDLTKKMETRLELKVWQKIRVLVLGHHGSQTSTSEALLKKLPYLSLAIASARKKKYGHPHWSVEGRLRKYGIPLLRTEDWGHIHIGLPHGSW